MEAAGIRAPSEMQGESLMPLLMGRKENWKRDALYYHYYEYPDVHMVKRRYGVVTKEFKLIHFYFDVDEWELYDRVKDPGEMKNVYNETAYKETVVTLKKKLVELRATYKDSVELDQKFIDMHTR